MKTMLLLGGAALVLFSTAPESLANHRHHHHRHHHHRHGGGVRITSNLAFGAPNVPYRLYTAPPFQYGAPAYGGAYGGGYGQTVYHDTSHYDYHPGYVVPHGDHVDYVPGHYHLHQSGHYDTYYPR